MSKKIKIFIFISVIFFLQMGIFPRLAVLGVYPNIIFISLISLSVLAGFKKAFPWAVFSGLFFDIYSLNNFIGIFIINFIVCAYFSSVFTQNIFKKNSFLSVFSVFGITIIIYIILNFILNKIIGIGFEFKVLNSLIFIIYSTITAMPVFYLFKKIYAPEKRKL